MFYMKNNDNLENRAASGADRDIFSEDGSAPLQSENSGIGVSHGGGLSPLEAGTAKKSRKITISDLCFIAIFTALTFVSTFINIRLPIPANGGLIHMGNIPLVAAAIVFSRRHGAIAGAVGMALFDIMGGWLAWAPFTFVIRGVMGYVVGLIAGFRGGKNMFINVLAIVCGGVILIVGYYFAEVIIYSSWYTPFASVPGNALQALSALVIGLPVTAALQKALKFALPKTRR
jgi:uncharacterized membrane protein